MEGLTGLPASADGVAEAAALLRTLRPCDAGSPARLQADLEDWVLAGALAGHPAAQSRVARAAHRIADALALADADALAEAARLLDEAAELLGDLDAAERVFGTGSGAGALPEEEGGEEPDPDLLPDFIAESRACLRVAEAALRELELDPGDVEALNEVFRGLHTIKGLAAFAGVAPVADLAHQSEALFDRFRRREMRCAGAAASLAFQALHQLGSLLDAADAPRRPPTAPAPALASPRPAADGLVPLRSPLEKASRLAEDVARRCGKRVEVVFEVEHLEIRGDLAAAIGRPLLHLIRNAVDHGIEPPEARAAGGKPAAGTLRLSAFRSGDSLVVGVEDDGRGMDRGRILHRARLAGLMPADRPAADGEILDLILEPGFSTAERLTQLSGRGVGMDVVKRDVEAAGGRLEIASEAGVGSRFTIRLPLARPGAPA